MTIALSDLSRALPLLDEAGARRLLLACFGVRGDQLAELTPSQALLTKLGEWLGSIGGLNEIQTHAAVREVARVWSNMVVDGWFDEDDPSPALIGLFDGRWLAIDDVFTDLVTGEQMEKLPHRHLWALACDLGCLWLQLRSRLWKTHDETSRPPQ